MLMQISVSQKSRIYIDVVKGIAIFLMLWGHCIQFCIEGSGLDFFENSVFQGIYSFHMPLFTLISGYLFYFSFQKRDMKELIICRSKPLLFSIFFCGIFIYYITTGLYGVLAGNIKALFFGEWLSSLSNLWFLWSILLSSVAVAVICKKIDNIILQLFCFILFCGVILLFPNVNLTLFVYPYFILGFYFAKFKNLIPTRLTNIIKYISLPVFPAMLLFYETKHLVYTTGVIGRQASPIEYLFIDSFRWIIGLVGSIFVMTVVEIIFNTISVKMTKPVFTQFFSAIGKNSLQIYCLSTAMLSSWLSKIFPYILNIFDDKNIFTTNIHIYNYLFTPLLAFAYCLGLYFVVKLLEKIKLSTILFGR